MSKSTIDSTIVAQSEPSVIDTNNTQAAPQMPSSTRKGSAHASRASARDTQSGDAAKLSAICQRLGLAGPLTFRPVKLPVDHLVIRKMDPDVLRRGRDMAASFKQVGQLANLGVVPMDPKDAPDGEAKYYEVWFGRARREGARILYEEEHCPEWEQLWCNVYDLPADPAVGRKMRAAMAFIENAQRSTPWVEELRQVVELLDAGTPLTAEEFWQVFRLTPATAKALLKIAQLPRPILDQVFAGQLRSRELLNRVVRLKAAQQAALVHEAQHGVTITEELVGRALRGQVSQAFASPAIQAALGQGWERTSDPSSGRGPVSNGKSVIAGDVVTAGGVDNIPADAPVGGNAVTPDAGARGSHTLENLLATVRAALPPLATQPAYGQAYLLAEALVTELDPLVPTQTASTARSGDVLP
jgi:ParB-like chromosome segregation protein Spo0J